MLGVRRWRELVTDKEKNGGMLFDRSKPTAGCSANGEEKKKKLFTEEKRIRKDLLSSEILRSVNGEFVTDVSEKFGDLILKGRDLLPLGHLDS
jgi:hypothetical protein